MIIIFICKYSTPCLYCKLLLSVSRSLIVRYIVSEGQRDASDIFYFCCRNVCTYLYWWNYYEVTIPNIIYINKTIKQYKTQKNAINRITKKNNNILTKAIPTNKITKPASQAANKHNKIHIITNISKFINNITKSNSS